jgi:hypothetical protein
MDMDRDGNAGAGVMSGGSKGSPALGTVSGLGVSGKRPGALAVGISGVKLVLAGCST